MKDIDLDAHIKVLKKTIRANREIVEASIIDCFISLYKTIFRSGAKILYKIIPITLMRSWNKCFANIFEL
jgi:hypothetical protein